MANARSVVPGSLLLLGAVLLGSPASCGGGGGAAKFSTSVPGDKPLGTLTDGELATLCSDGAKFAAASTSRMDTCRFGAFLTAALEATFSLTATDSELQMSCTETYNQCLSPPADGGAGPTDGGAGPTDGGAGDMCQRPAANCTATVNEFVTCINDQTAQAHATALAIPACSAVSRASLTADAGAPTTTQTTPASCQVVQAKCSGLSDAAKTFVDQYCALIAPCCTQAHLTSQCTSQVLSAAQGSFDQNAADACVAALNNLQAGADFCGHLGVSFGPTAPWAVIPACAAVFQTPGTAAVGQPCNVDSDCAPGPGGRATCLSDTVTGDGGDVTFVQTCAQITGKVGDPCYGTAAYGGISFSSPHTGFICDHDRGVVCDEQTSLCVAGLAAGQTCNSFDQCAPALYCNFAGQSCAAILGIGATCQGSIFGECEPNAYCNDTTKRCTAKGGAGAACTLGPQPTCLSGFCNNGTCTNPLSPLCL